MTQPFIAAILVLLTPALAVAQQPRPEPVVVTTGEGLVQAVPDRAWVNLTAESRAGSPRDHHRDRAARRDGKLSGVGRSTYVEICSFGPSSMLSAGGWEWGSVRIERSGRVTVITGATPHGQGQETSFAQITADQFGVLIPHASVLIALSLIMVVWMTTRLERVARGQAEKS